MRRIAFVGPSIPPNAAQALAPEVTLLPPARAGDVYRAVGHGEARVIGLVDGVFGSVGSVWHKEILFAISRGGQVSGGAGRGAFREAWGRAVRALPADDPTRRAFERIDFMGLAIAAPYTRDARCTSLFFRPGSFLTTQRRRLI